MIVGSTIGYIITLSALCYFIAEALNAPRVIGSPAFVASDVLMVVAMVLVGASGISALYVGLHNLVSGGGGDNPADGILPFHMESKTPRGSAQ